MFKNLKIIQNNNICSLKLAHDVVDKWQLHSSIKHTNSLNQTSYSHVTTYNYISHHHNMQ